MEARGRHLAWSLVGEKCALETTTPVAPACFPCTVADTPSPGSWLAPGDANPTVLGGASVVRVLVAPFGTGGDVHPCVGVGVALRQRGHDVSLMVNDHFRPMAENNELDFIPIGTAQWYKTAIQNPALTKTLAGARAAGRYMLETIEPYYRAIAENYEPGNTVVLATWNAFGARIAHDKLGVPLITLALQPALFPSAYKMPPIGTFPRIPNWLPRPMVRGLIWGGGRLADRFVCASKIDAYRAKLGLPPNPRPLANWWLSPQLIIALFPDWYAEPQPDWPPAVRMTGFPLFDREDQDTTLPADVARFLDEGTPPIVFTPGTGNPHDHEFFQTAVEVCHRLGRRAMLLTPHASQVPSDLPRSICHFPYLPFSQVLPKAAAIVHHGGVGTTSQAMAGGIPQLVIPMVNDQPDNALRVKELGVGDWLKLRAFRTSSATTRLGSLLSSKTVASCCAEIQRRIASQEPLRETCELIEEFAAEAG